MPRQHVENTKEFGSENEAKRANKHANKRIIYWPPFWNKVYGSMQISFLSYVKNTVTVYEKLNITKKELFRELKLT